MANKKMVIDIETEGIDEAINQVERLVELLKEAKTLVEELASNQGRGREHREELRLESQKNSKLRAVNCLLTEKKFVK